MDTTAPVYNIWGRSLYRAANWIRGAETKGRDTYDRKNQRAEPVKAVFSIRSPGISGRSFVADQGPITADGRPLHPLQAKGTACGKTRKGTVPKKCRSGFGSHLCALVAKIGAIDRSSRETIQSFCPSVPGVKLILGAIEKVIDRAFKTILSHDEAIRDKARSMKPESVRATTFPHSHRGVSLKKSP
ncbi:hypothetical protein [Desulfosoma caldarium]|uniref:Uncharacterized protein n=1 Tax=Desulfosoma caldarium TaxID=610254 RepID=A0A3N1UN12_9BACT|nr:hypothetical protein [Desulfosoma caldarium]ROQ90120.1 hypothetical protein EDC27_2723 [Desulfosoma caldarium]